jgi:hypothetical protein
MRPHPFALIPRSTARPRTTGLLTKNASWARWSSHGTLAERLGLSPGAGGLDHQDLDLPERVGHSPHKLDGLPLVGHVGVKRIGNTTVASNGAHNLEREPVVVDR